MKTTDRQLKTIRNIIIEVETDYKAGVKGFKAEAINTTITKFLDISFYNEKEYINTACEYRPFISDLTAFTLNLMAIMFGEADRLNTNLNRPIKKLAGIIVMLEKIEKRLLKKDLASL